MNLNLVLLFNGGKGSGNFGHAGRPGLVGGSGDGKSEKKSSLKTISEDRIIELAKYEKSEIEFGSSDTPQTIFCKKAYKELGYDSQPKAIEGEEFDQLSDKDYIKTYRTIKDNNSAIGKATVEEQHDQLLNGEMHLPTNANASLGFGIYSATNLAETKQYGTNYERIAIPKSAKILDVTNEKEIARLEEKANKINEKLQAKYRKGYAEMSPQIMAALEGYDAAFNPETGEMCTLNREQLTIDKTLREHEK